MRFTRSLVEPSVLCPQMNCTESAFTAIKNEKNQFAGVLVRPQWMLMNFGRTVYLPHHVCNVL